MAQNGGAAGREAPDGAAADSTAADGAAAEDLPAAGGTPGAAAHGDDVPALADPQSFRSLAVRRLLSRHGHLWTEQVSAENTSIQFGLLLCLARSEAGLSHSEIAVQLAVDKATLTELVSRMATRGHVAVHRDARDGRRRVATLTEAGRDLLLELYRPALEVNDQLFDPLTAEEGEQLMGLLRRILDHEPAPDRP